MQTSFFKNIEHLDESHVVVVSIGMPKWMPAEQQKRLKKATELMPTWDMVKKNYTYEEYISFLCKRGVTPNQILSKYGESVLLCHERNPKGCHRRMIARWVEDELGIIVPEVDIVTGTKKMTSKEKVVGEMMPAMSIVEGFGVTRRRSL